MPTRDLAQTRDPERAVHENPEPIEQTQQTRFALHRELMANPQFTRNLIEGRAQLRGPGLMRMLDHVGTFREVPARPRGVSAPPGPLRLTCVKYIGPLSYVKDRVRPLGTRKLDLVGVTEVKEFLGVSRQRVHQLIRDDTGFPNPVAELAAGRIWLREDIEEWARSCGRLERDDRAVSRARGKRRRL